MSQIDTSPSTAMSEAADALIERRNPSDIDRLRETIGFDVLPAYRDEQAVVGAQQARARWPHLVAFADSRAAPSSAHPAHALPPSSPPPSSPSSVSPLSAG
ncbi:MULTISPECIES: hypothetical protein [unclassified Pandoraea]|uniref:hypothetical protein n=1 Tax=unclassified Pandoraea TaxID=2624094 RepID=UPI001124FC85|nr:MULTISPECIES: hypothetical protein [unclassified Pandoraea]